MNILFLTKELPFPQDTGFRNRTFHLLQGLYVKHDVSLVCFGEKDMQRIDGLQKCCRKIHLVSPKAINKKPFVILASLFWPLPFSVQSRYSNQMSEKVNELITTGSFDLIICDSIYQAIHVPFGKIRCILEEHNIESEIIGRYAKMETNPFKKWFANIEYRKMRRYEYKMWQKFNLCLGISAQDKEIIQGRLPQVKVDNVPNGVDVEYFKPENNNAKPQSLVYVGQMNWHPNINAMHYFLRNIYPLIKQKAPGTTMQIVGSNPPDSIKRLAGNNGCTITGRVDDTRSYISNAEVSIVPLRIGGGTRLKILEAMAMAKPVVSTSIGCEGLEVENEKNILIADKPEDFAMQVIRIFNDKSLAERIGKAGRQLVESRYSWDNITDKLNSIIENEIHSA